MHFTDRMSLWTRGVAEQIAFWTVWIKSRGANWPEEFAARLNPQSQLSPVIAKLIPADTPLCRILDTGAGPLTCLGKQAHVPLVVDACDPLAKVYNILLQINGVTPLVQTRFADVEHLSVFYPANHYDITHCRNALDHSLDPMGGLIEMLRVTKVGGYVVLDHELNEGVNAGYAGFHQYNFDIQDGRFVIWNPSVRIDVAEGLPIPVEIELIEPNGSHMFQVIIRKLADFDDSAAESHLRPQMSEMLEHLFDRAVADGLAMAPVNATPAA